MPGIELQPATSTTVTPHLPVQPQGAEAAPILHRPLTLTQRRPAPARWGWEPLKPVTDGFKALVTGKHNRIYLQKRAVRLEELLQAVHATPPKRSKYIKTLTDRYIDFQPQSWARAVRLAELESRTSNSRPRFPTLDEESARLLEGAGVQLRIEDFSDLELQRLATDQPLPNDGWMMPNPELDLVMIEAYRTVLDALEPRMIGDAMRAPRDVADLVRQYATEEGTPSAPPAFETTYSSSAPDPTQPSHSYSYTHTWPDGTQDVKSWTHAGPDYHQQVFDFQHPNGDRFRHVHQFNLRPFDMDAPD